MKTDINNIIKQRRSIYPKEYNGEQIEDSIIETLLENANYAPNHYSNYPWRFIVISPNKINDFFTKAAQIYKESVFEEKFDAKKFEKTKDNGNLVSHVIAIIYQKDTEDTKSTDIENTCAIACAVQNIALSLSQYENVGGYWSTGLGTHSSKMAEYLKMSKNQSLMGFFILGKTDTKRTEGSKKSYKNFVSYL